MNHGRRPCCFSLKRQLQCWLWLGAVLVSACSEQRTLTLTLPDGGASASADQLARACIIATSCAGPGSPYAASRCIEEMGRAAFSGLEALQAHMLACAKHPGCEEFRACWGGGLVMVEPRVTHGVCEGDTMVAPKESPPFPALSFDCAAIGARCVGMYSGDYSIGCNARSCDPSDATEPACVGTVASGCGGVGEYTRVDCAASSSTCEVRGRRALCTGTGATCTESDTVRCHGSVAEYCRCGAIATLDCATVPFRTACLEGSVFNQACSPAGKECDAFGFLDRCDGRKLQVCADGFIASVDCTQLGFASCQIYAVGPGHCREEM